MQYNRAIDVLTGSIRCPGQAALVPQFKPQILLALLVCLCEGKDRKELETLRESLSFHMRHDPSQDGLRVGLTNVFQLNSGKAASENKSATQCGLMHERIRRTAIKNDKWNSVMVVASKVVTLFCCSICKRGRRDWILEGSRRETACSWRISIAAR